MTVKFRVDEVHLETENGPVSYVFKSPLTVLAGGVGVGKSTLFEAIKYALGGSALLAPVMEEHVYDVAVSITAGQNRYRLVRGLSEESRTTIRVTDLVTQERMRDHQVDGEGPLISDLLMAALGLPTNATATARSNRSNKPGSRVTFNDVFSYMYVPQEDMARDIAHSEDSYREPKRKTVFELLFGLTSPEHLQIRSKIAELRGDLKVAEHDSAVVEAFLIESGTVTRVEAEIGESAALDEEATARRDMDQLRNEVFPAQDRTSQTLRDLLAEAEVGLAEATNLEAILTQQAVDLERERHRVQQDLDRLLKMEDAGERLANIEFQVCPRCLQDISRRDTPHGHCRLCLQTENGGEAEPAWLYERAQLAEQVDEMADQIAAGELQLEQVRTAIGHRQALVERVGRELDEHSRDRVSPRLQAFADASRRLTEAESRQREFGAALRQWDRAADLEAAASALRMQLERNKRTLEMGELELAERKAQIFDELDAEFESTVASIGIPGVESAAIDRKSYLPTLNGKAFKRFSPPGGIRTATQVAYWTTLLTVALRRRDTLYPTFLLIDSPRTSLNDSDRLAAALYRRLVTQADLGGDRMQIIIGDNELPSEYRKQYEQIDFTYESPTVRPIHHPGPDAVVPIYTSLTS